MSDSEETIIKPSLAFPRLSDDGFLSRFMTIDRALDANASIYPTPPISKADRSAAIATFTTSMTAALDGSKKAKAARNQLRKKMNIMLRTLGHYVELESKGNMDAFLASGFDPAPTKRTPAAPLTEGVRSIDHGENSGQVVMRLKRLENAALHQVRYGAVINGAAPAPWIEVLVHDLRKAFTITGLTPGTTYAFQTRAAIKGSYTDWSDSVTFICT